MSKSDGLNPRAPHWYDFNEVNNLPNDWTFEVLEWDDDPDAENVVDRGEAEVTRGSHRFVITTWLVPRSNTHDHFWSIAYETINQDGEDEPLSFFIGRTSSIARNNLGHARDSIDHEEAAPHVLVRKYPDDTRETFEYPTEFMAEKAADLQHRLKMDIDDRDYMAFVESKEDWEERLELERDLAAIDGGGVDAA
jgi:hypothetical protein